MSSIPPAQESAHAEAKRRCTSALYNNCTEEPSCAQNLFGDSSNERPLPDPKGLDNNGYICEYNQLSGIERALEKRILNSQTSHKN